MQTPILETERILLRPLKISDAETAYQNWTSDPEVAKFVRWNLHTSVDDTITWLTEAESNIESETHYDWGFVCKESNVLFGAGGLFYNEDHGMFELGYNMMQSYWGRGLATEAAKAMIDFAIDVLGETKLFVCHAKENLASRKVIEKLGFVYQKDGTCESYDGERVMENREYYLLADESAGGE